MNLVLSTLWRGRCASLPHQLLSTSTNIRGQILFSARVIPVPIHDVCSFHWMPKCMKWEKGETYHKAVHLLPTHGNFPQIRCFQQSLVSRSKDEGHEDKQDKTITWEFSLCNSYGMLSIKTDKSVRIKMIDILQQPGGKFAAFHLLGRDEERRPDKGDILVDYDEGMNRLSLVDNKRQAPSDERWILEVPPYYDLTLEHTGVATDTIQVENLENQTITVRSVGDIHVHNLKSSDVNLDTTEGEVRSTKVIQGNAVVRTTKHKGFIADKLQGQKFDIQTEDGNIQCKDIYGISSRFSSERGNIHLGNVTGDCSVITQGDVILGSVDGSLEAKVSHTGSVQAYLVRPASVSISAERGNVSVSFPTDVKCHLDLAAHNINIPAEMSLQVLEAEGHRKMKGSLNKGLSPVSVSSKDGSISVSMQSWFDSLNLGS